MKKLTVSINTDNDAFFPSPENEISRILSEIAKNINTYALDKYQGKYVYDVLDINGNSVGKVVVS